MRAKQMIRIGAAAAALLTSALSAAPPTIQSIVDVSAPARLDSDLEEGGHRWWVRFDSGLNPEQESARLLRALQNERFENPGEPWSPVEVPAPISRHPGYRSGVQEIWYLKVFRLPSRIPAPLALELGEIDDRDRTYLNGTLIGATGDWDAVEAQAYDRARLYTPPPGLFRSAAVNILLVQVRGYTPDDFGFLQGATAIGPAVAIQKRRLVADFVEVVLQSTYAMAGLYFLFWFLRRRVERENLFFGLFAINFAIYQFLRTQLKYEFGIDLLWLKRIEYLCLFLGVPLLYYFVRYYFRLNTRWAVVIHWLARAATLFAIGGAVFVVVSNRTDLWWVLQRDYIQPTWLVLLGGAMATLLYAAWKGTRDAAYMMVGFVVLMAGAVNDALVARNLIQSVDVLSYAFVGFMLGLASVVINRSVRHARENEELNLNLESLVEKRTAELASAHDALWGEMQLARKLQTVLLPAAPVLPGYELKAYTAPATEVGGDYYDLIFAGGRHWIVIGDVSGHGVSAGLIMMMVQTAIHAALARRPEGSIVELLAAVNRVIFENIRRLQERKYMTINVLSEAGDGHFHFAGAHQDILIYRAAERRVEAVETRGMWLGIMEEIGDDLPTGELKLARGDTMLLYTDGLTEARAADGALVGDAYLRRLLLQGGQSSLSELQNAILDELAAYLVDDDATFLLLRRSQD